MSATSQAPRGALRPPLRRRLLAAVAPAAIVLIADRVSKAAVLVTIARTGRSLELVSGVLDFRFAVNDGMAFSLGSGLGAFSVALAVLVTVGGAVYLVRAPAVSRLEPIGLGLVWGGAIGNALDRIAHGAVTDFIAIRFISFPVFNVADIGITIGVAAALIGFVALSPANRGAAEAADRDRPACAGASDRSVDDDAASEGDE